MPIGRVPVDGSGPFASSPRPLLVPQTRMFSACDDEKLAVDLDVANVHVCAIQYDNLDVALTRRNRIRTHVFPLRQS